MIVCATGNNINSSLLKPFAKCLRILNDHLCIVLKFRLKRFFETYCLGSDHVHQRTTLDSRKYCFVKIKLLGSGRITEDHTPSWSTKCFVSGGGSHICIRNGAWMLSCCHKSCNMCHINHQICPYFICNLTEFLKINDPCISTCTCHDQLRSAFSGNTGNFFIIDHTVIIYSIIYRLEVGSGHICSTSMCQMSAVIQIHTHYSISRLQHCKKDCHVCLCSGVRLYICIFTSE